MDGKVFDLAARLGTADADAPAVFGEGADRLAARENVALPQRYLSC